MKLKKVLIGAILIVVLLALPLVLAGVTHAQNQNYDQSAVLYKLDQVLESQRTMMAEIQSLKQELNIIKIRVTQSQ